jgi:hypothetical protein
MVCMDRADEPLIVFKTNCRSFVHKIEFYFLQRGIFRKIVTLYVNGATLLQMCKRLFATIWQICHMVSENTGNPLAIC